MNALGATWPYSKPAALLLTLIAFVLLAAAVAGTAFTFRTTPTDRVAAPAAPTAPGPAGAEQVYPIGKVVAAHLFGDPGAKKVESAPTQAPQTKLRLTLLGVVASADSGVARAVIRVENEQARSYAIGDVLEKTDAKLHSIQAGQVLLSRKGKFESLPLLRPETSGQRQVPLPSATVPGRPRRQTSGVRPPRRPAPAVSARARQSQKAPRTRTGDKNSAEKAN